MSPRSIATSAARLTACDPPPALCDLPAALCDLPAALCVAPADPVPAPHPPSPATASPASQQQITERPRRLFMATGCLIGHLRSRGRLTPAAQSTAGGATR